MTPSDDILREIIQDDPSRTGLKRPMTQYQKDKREREDKEAVELGCAIIAIIAVVIVLAAVIMWGARSIAESNADLQKRIEQGCVWQPVSYNRNDCVVPKEKK